MVDWMASKVVSRRVAFSLRAGEEPRDGHHRVTTNDELPEGSSVGRQVLPSYSGPIIDAGSAACMYESVQLTGRPQIRPHRTRTTRNNRKQPEGRS